MANVVLEDGQHTFDASAKEITLSAPYETLSLGQIISIIDLTTNDILYDSRTQRTDAISISGAAITHTHGNTGQADADLLQVVVDIGGSATIPIHVSTGGAVASTVGDGRKEVTTAGIRLALATSTAVKEVTVTAEEDNTGIVVVGGATVVAALATRQGTPLNPLDSTTIATDNLAEVYIDSMVSTEGVTFTYLA